MSKPVDTTRPEDAISTGPRWFHPQHHKDDTVVTDVRVMLDAWSGDPDTDKAWAHEPNWHDDPANWETFGDLPDDHGTL